MPRRPPWAPSLLLLRGARSSETSPANSLRHVRADTSQGGLADPQGTRHHGGPGAYHYHPAPMFFFRSHSMFTAPSSHSSGTLSFRHHPLQPSFPPLPRAGAAGAALRLSSSSIFSCPAVHHHAFSASEQVRDSINRRPALGLTRSSRKSKSDRKGTESAAQEGPSAINSSGYSSPFNDDDVYPW